MHGTPFCPHSTQLEIENGLSDQRGTFCDKIEFVKTIHKISGFPGHLLTLIIKGIEIKNSARVETETLMKNTIYFKFPISTTKLTFTRCTKCKDKKNSKLFQEP